MKYIKLFEDFDPREIPQSEPQFTQWIIKNAPKSFTKPQEWFEEELGKSIPNWAYIGYIIKEIGLLNRLSIPKGAKEELEIDGWSKDHIESFSLLHWAAIDNRSELAKGLIDAGADVNAQDKYKQTPLHLAAMEGHTELAKALIDARADVNAENKNKWTPLHFAAYQNHIELAKGLIEAGADVNAEDKNKRAPWDVAKPQMREALPELNPNGESL